MSFFPVIFMTSDRIVNSIPIQPEPLTSELDHLQLQKQDSVSPKRQRWSALENSFAMLLWSAERRYDPGGMNLN